MPKVSLIDRAIAQLQGEIDVLQMAILKLKAQQQAKPRPQRQLVAEAKRATDAA